MLDRAFETFKNTTGRPTLIIVDSHIGYGAPTKQDTHAAHGEPLGEEEIKLAKTLLRLAGGREVPGAGRSARSTSRSGIGARGKMLRDGWMKLYEAYKEVSRRKPTRSMRMQKRQLPDGWDRGDPDLPGRREGHGRARCVGQGAQRSREEDSVADRRLGRPRAVDEDAAHVRGCRRLRSRRRSAAATSTSAFASTPWPRSSTAWRCRKLRPYGSGFLIFSDYGRAPIRLAAIMEIPVIYVFTHDSIGVGEDGPTHQPIEQILSLRAIPGLITIRPGDANEVSEAWKFTLASRHHPVALILTRQALPTLDRTKYAPASGLAKGAYVLADAAGGNPEAILIGTGSEVSLCLTAHELLTKEGIRSRVVSMPSWELFDDQPAEYRNSVLPPSVTARVAVEQASTMGWHRYVGSNGRVIGMRTFGASAPLSELQKKFGFQPDVVAKAAREQLGKA